MKFAVLDTETTGVRPGLDRVIEIAVAVYENGLVISSHYGLHNPCVPIPAGASAVNGWTDERVADAPVLEKRHAEQLLQILQDVEGPIYVHNVEFDREILAGDFRRVGADVQSFLDLPWSCTLKMARELWPGLENNLGMVAERLAVDVRGVAHQAGTDVDTLGRCVEQIVHRYAHRGHKGALVKATVPVPALAVDDSIGVLVMAGSKAKALLPRVVAAQDWAAQYVCDDDMDERNGHDALGRVKKLQAEADAERKGVVEPIKAITGKVDELFREKIAKPCDAIRFIVEAKLGLYATAKLKKHREAEAKAEAELEAARAKAEAEAAEARRQQAAAELAAAKVQLELEAAELAARRAGDVEATAKINAARAQAESAQANITAAANVAEAARQQAVIEAQGALIAATAEDGPIKAGAAIGGYKSKWTVTITDPSKVPDVYWRPDLALVQKAVDQGARTILGCEIIEVSVMSNRRRG